jgi:hypothetical protein
MESVGLIPGFMTRSMLMHKRQWSFESRQMFRGEHVASIFGVEDKAKQVTSMK